MQEPKHCYARSGRAEGRFRRTGLQTPGIPYQTKELGPTIRTPYPHPPIRKAGKYPGLVDVIARPCAAQGSFEVATQSRLQTALIVTVTSDADGAASYKLPPTAHGRVMRLHATGELRDKLLLSTTKPLGFPPGHTLVAGLLLSDGLSSYANSPRLARGWQRAETPSLTISRTPGPSCSLEPSSSSTESPIH